MNKKVEKAIGKALAASLVTGVAASVAPSVSAAEVDFNQLYKTAYNAVTKAKAEGTQAAINEARTAINALKGTKAEFAVGEFSKQVDTVQGPKLVAIVKAIMKAQASVKQADINAAKALIEPELPTFWKNSYSQATDNVQRTLLEKVDAAVKKAAETKTAEDIAAAKALVDDLKTAASATIANIGLEAEKALAQVKVAVKLDSVTAVGVKKIEVKFSGAVDTAKVSIEVKRGSVTTSVNKVTFSDDKTTATLELNSRLMAGDYTINVTGAADTTLSKVLTAQDERVGAVTFTADTAVITKANAKQITTGYKVVNQYGEDITNATSLQYTVGVVGAVVSVGNGTITVTKGTSTGADTADFKADDKVSITLIHTATSTVVTKVVNVTAESTLSEVSVKSLYNADNKALTTDVASGDVNKFMLVVEAKDQYGNVIDNLTRLGSELLVAVSNPSAVSVNGYSATTNAATFSTETINGVSKTVLKLAGGLNVGTSVVTLIPKTNPTKAITFAVNVAEGVVTDTVSFGSVDKLVSAGETVQVPVYVTDKNGNTITDATQISTTPGAAKYVGVTGVTGTFKTVDGKLVYEFTAAQGPVTLTAVTRSAKIAIYTLDVKATAVPTTIVGLKADAPKLVYKGENLTLTAANFVIQDQYGRTMDTTTGTYSITATEAKPAPATGTDDSAVVASSLVFNGLNKGTEDVTFALTGVTGSEYTANLRTVELSEIKSVTVDETGSVYADATNTTGVDTYDREIKVYGVTADGQKVLIPAREYNVIVTAGNLAAQPQAKSATDATVNKYVIDAYAGTLDAGKDYSASYVVTINATGQEIKKDVTVSTVAPTVANVVYKVGSDVKTAIDFTVSSTANTFSVGSLTGINVTDTYGVDNAVSSTPSRVTFSKIVDKDTAHALSVSANGTSSAAISGLEAGDTFDVTAIVGGKTLTVSVTVK